MSELEKWRLNRLFLYPFNTLYSATSESTASLVKILFLIVETVFGLIAKICAIEFVEFLTGAGLRPASCYY